MIACDSAFRGTLLEACQQQARQEGCRVKNMITLS